MIYALVHPHTLEVRYIGKTKTSGAQRMASHAYQASVGRKTALYDWWRKLLAAGDGAPCLARLGDGDSAEEIRWIAEVKARGARLLNLTDGGDGVTNPTPEVRAVMSAKASARVVSSATREKLRQQMLGNKRGSKATRLFGKDNPAKRPEVRAKISASRMGQKPSAESLAKTHTPETHAKIAAALRGRKLSPEHRAKIAESLRGNQHTKGHTLSAEHRAACGHGKSKPWLGKKLSAEHRAKITAGLRGNQNRARDKKTPAA